VGRPFNLSPGRFDQVFIDSKNSPLFLVLRSLSSRKSIASMVPIGLRIRRSTYIFFSTCGSVISSSLRVPEREMSIAGKVRLSETLRSRISSEVAGALELFEDHFVHAAAWCRPARSR